MVKIELRKDGWFEAEKKARGLTQILYWSKQNIKTALIDLSNKNLILSALESTLKDIAPQIGFKETPFVHGDKIYIYANIGNLPKKTYLGKIIYTR